MPLLVAAIVSTAGLVAAWTQRGKYKADAAKSLTSSAVEMVETWERRVKELEATVKEQGKEIVRLKAQMEVLGEENKTLFHGAERLVTQVEARGEVPEWRPGEEL